MAKKQTIVIDPTSVEDTTPPPAVVDAPIVVDPNAPRLDIATAGLLVAMAKVNVEKAAEMTAVARAELGKHLAIGYREDASKSHNILTPDGQKVGQVTIKETLDTTVLSDPEGFKEWVENNFPSEVEIQTVVRAAFAKRVLEREIIWIEDDEWVAPEPPEGADDTYVAPQCPLVAVHEPTGQRAPWVILRAGKVDVDSFSLTFAKPSVKAAVTVNNRADGREIITDWMGSTDLQAAMTSLVTGRPIQPQINA